MYMCYVPWRIQYASAFQAEHLKWWWSLAAGPMDSSSGWSMITGTLFFLIVLIPYSIAEHCTCHMPQTCNLCKLMRRECEGSSKIKRNHRGSMLMPKGQIMFDLLVLCICWNSIFYLSLLQSAALLGFLEANSKHSCHCKGCNGNKAPFSSISISVPASYINLHLGIYTLLIVLWRMLITLIVCLPAFPFFSIFFLG